ncbi:MAG: hypothetical protein HXX16_03840 [Bacteroidales bacterium]|nr:hypothetical protein [Bacteroidales bacterium]
MTIKFTRKQRIRIQNLDDAFKIMKEILLCEDKIDDKEYFWVMSLSQNNNVRYVVLISMDGGLTKKEIEKLKI